MTKVVGSSVLTCCWNSSACSCYCREIKVDAVWVIRACCGSSSSSSCSDCDWRPFTNRCGPWSLHPLSLLMANTLIIILLMYSCFSSLALSIIVNKSCLRLWNTMFNRADAIFIPETTGRSSESGRTSVSERTSLVICPLSATDVWLHRVSDVALQSLRTFEKKLHHSTRP